MSMPSPRFSLVIPAYNEEAYLPRLLDTVDEARRQYHRGSDAVEIIVADNGSTDGTGAIARQRGCQVVPVEKRAIAAARNGGAAAAQGETFCFLDADSLMHPQTFNEIERTVEAGRFVAGATGVKLERLSLGLALTYALFLPMLLVTGMDTGVVFCRRQDFETIGGYNEDRLYAEDVQFLLDLRRLGKTRGQRLVRVSSARAIASTRKFDEHGDWHYFVEIIRYALKRPFRPKAVEDFAKRYWYDVDR